MTLPTERVLLFAAAVPVVYLLMLATGRWLKRSAGVPFGPIYQLFCIVFAVYAPMKALGLRFTAPPFDAERDLGAAVIVLGAALLVPLLHRFLWEGYFHTKRRTEIPTLLRQVAALLIMIVAVLAVLHIGYGKDITGLVLTSTVAVGVIAFSMQDTLASIMSGISIQIAKPFRAGDWLEIDKKYGEVIEVNWRSTRLRTNDHIYLDIPNHVLVKNTIVNLCYPTRLHAMRLRIGIAYDAPPNQVKAILRHAAECAVGAMTAPPPKAFLVEFGESAAVYEVKFWMEDHALYNDCADAIRTNIWYGLQRADIRIPYPVRVLRKDQVTPAQPEIPPPARRVITRQPLFQCLSEAESDRLLASAHLTRFGAGEHLIDQGEEGNSMGILTSGKAEVLVRRDESETRVAELGPGDYFGEMSLLTGEQRSATVRAVTDCEVIEIDKAALAPVLQDNEKLLRSLSEMLARRRMETEGVLASTTEKQALMTKQREYTASFLSRLYSFFEL